VTGAPVASKSRDLLNARMILIFTAQSPFSNGGRLGF
jgi:hypothetical protein